MACASVDCDGAHATQEQRADVIEINTRPTERNPKLVR